MGSGKVETEKCEHKIGRALDLAVAGNAEIWSAMPGLQHGRMILGTKLMAASPDTVQRLCRVHLGYFEGKEQMRDLVAAYIVVEELATGAAVDAKALTLRLQILPVAEVRFRLAQRVQQLVAPVSTPPVRDMELADPLLVGSSISGPNAKKGGSITCFVTDVDTREPLMLTCHHVLRPDDGPIELDTEERAANASGAFAQHERELKAVDVFQPSMAYGKAAGRLVRGIKSIDIDAAVARINRKYANATREGVNVRRLGSIVKVGDPVWKRGAGSRVQRGMVIGLSSYGPRLVLSFSVFDAFGNGRTMHSDDDDGCALFDARNNLIGIIVGIDDGGVKSSSPCVVASPIGRVFEALNVQLAT